MRFLISVAALALPILDIASLIAVGDRIGVWPTVAAVLVSGLVGTILVRTQGFTIAQQARVTLQAGRFPAREVFDGACVLIGGALLIFPGFVSDAIGLMLLVAPVRRVLRSLIGGVVRRSRSFEVFASGGSEPRQPGDGPIIDGEYRPIDEAPSRLVPRAPASEAHSSPWRRS
jgi:UPF0716 protein FxsA